MAPDFFLIKAIQIALISAKIPQGKIRSLCGPKRGLSTPPPRGSGHHFDSGKSVANVLEVVAVMNTSEM
jgi:hypothetical protein